jgi:hypothetical protein
LLRADAPFPCSAPPAAARELHSTRPDPAGGVVRRAAAQAGGATAENRSIRSLSAGEGEALVENRCGPVVEVEELLACELCGGVEKREREWSGWVRGVWVVGRWDAASL